MIAPRFVETFIVEAEELLADIDRAALALEAGGPSQDLVNELFRAFHTIKGSASMCGLDGIVNFTHHVENLLDRVREGKIPVTPPLINLVLRSEDQISCLLGVEQGQPGPDDSLTQKLISDLCAHAGLPLPTALAKKPVKASDQDFFL